MFEFFPYEAVDVNYQTDDLLVGTVKDENLVGGLTNRTAIALATSNLQSLYKFLKEHCPEPMHEKASSERGSRGDFYNFESYEEAMDVFSNRPYEVRKFTAKEEMVKVEDNSGKDVSYDVWGDFVDIDNYLMGVPETMGRFTMGNPLGLFAQITMGVNVPHYVSQEVINYRAERVIRLVDWLESQRIRTKITALSLTQCEMTEFVLKQFEEQLDLNNLAVVAHSDFLRRMLFRVKEYSKTWSYGYGTSHDVSKYRQYRKKSESGILVDIGWFETKEKIDEEFDNVEKELFELLETQGRFYEKVVTGGKSW